jgi:hypothetical protein
MHQFLQNAGFTAQANNINITEDGWCVTATGGCNPPILTEAQKDNNIAVVINQLATVPWIQGFWYFNLHSFSSGGSAPSDFNSYALYTFLDYDSSGNPVYAQTPAWTAFQTAAASAESTYPSAF